MNTLSSNDLYAVYMAFYATCDQYLILKEKYNPYYASRKPVPTTLKEAVLNGFLWGENNEDAIFWHNYYNLL